MHVRLLCAWLAGAQADQGPTTLSSRRALASTAAESQLRIQEEHGGSVSRPSTGLHHISAMLVAINSTADAIDYSAMDDVDAIINLSGSVLLIQRGHLFQGTQAATFQHTSQGRPADALTELPPFPSGAGPVESRSGGSYQNVSSQYAQKAFYSTLPMALLARDAPEVSTSTIIIASAIGIFVLFLIMCWGCGSSADPSSSDPPVTAPPPSSGYSATPTRPTPAPNALQLQAQLLQLQAKPRRQKYLGDGNTQAFCRELIVPDIRGANFTLNGKIMPYQQEEVFEIRQDGFMQTGEAVLKCMMSETGGQCGILLETSMGNSVIYLMTDEAVSPKGEHPPQQDRHVALVRMNNRELAADPLPTAVVERTNGHNNLCVRWCTKNGRPGDVFVSMLVHTGHGIDLRNKEGSLVATLKGQLGEHGRLHVARGMDVALVVSAMIAAFKLQ